MDIDIVVLWVDGNDPDWNSRKAQYQGKRVDDSNAINRFRDWGLMPYWFRAIESFAPWVRKIHFVTCGHVPEFLNLNHPKLHHVRHEDYLPEDSLPLFNASAIEMSIHKIPGLSDHFVFFNDDMFLLHPVSPEMFFVKGLPCAEGSEIIIPPMGMMKAWFGMAMNDIGIINQHFDKKQAVKRYHKKYIHHDWPWPYNGVN